MGVTLQETRAKQAMEEVGMKGDVKVIHSENPKTFINGKEYSLVFPRFILNIKEEKIIDKIFVGLITDSREKFLKNFSGACIISSISGRVEGVKEKDLTYFRMMARSFFSICPNGDFVWTYRFFEAILCRCIPIIEQECKLYKGYHFYKLGDVYEYREDWVKENLSKIKREMML